MAMGKVGAFAIAPNVEVREYWCKPSTLLYIALVLKN
jgi:hypothetical protein